jgi:bacillithiol biosynthesis cysteine-adding enzyme BshC
MRVPLQHYPGMNRFVLDWLGGDERFLRRATPNLNPHRRISLGPELVTAIDQSNRHWGIFAADALRKWSTGETLTIIAGQQVGFAGGPLYTLAKIATLVRFKRDMENQGIPVTPFFWLATEDHDFDEVATLCVPVKNQQRDLLWMRAVRTTPNRAIVGPQPIPETLITQLLSLVDLPRPTWLREGITFRDSFAELIASIFGSEVILLDALLPELRKAGAPLFNQIRTREAEIQSALRDRSNALKFAGYTEQVTPNEDGQYTLLYSLDAHDNRQPTTDNTPPERISTSALTRPLLQDAVIQPDIFVGGPAEVAYYAQLAPLHQLLGIRIPRVALRAHALIAPRRVLRAIDRYKIDPSEVFRSADEILAEREPEGVARIKAITERGQRDLLARIAEIGELALPADHSLAGSIQKSIGHLEWHFNKLSERAVKGLVRKEKERLAATRELVATLYPDGHVQDRIASWFAMWCEHGQHLVDRLLDELEPDSACFKIVEL